MDLTNFDFSLRWPKELFLWEASRISKLGRGHKLQQMVSWLFAEAFMDGDIAMSLENGVSAWPMSPTPAEDAAGPLLRALLKDSSKLHPYQKPQYWLERQSNSTEEPSHRSLAAELVDLIGELAEVGYFPDDIPISCVDDDSTWDVDPSGRMSRAIRANVSWPLDETPGAVSEDVVYSVIEYFHDRVSRPRTRSFHSYSNCGWHYDNHNRESGAAVYRWRISELLSSHGILMKLGSTGLEKGRLIRQAGLELDELANSLVVETTGSEDDKVAAAIRLYRARTSGVHEQRAAIAQLAGYLERHRIQFKAAEFTRGDEPDLFNIFNNFAIRHDNERQKNNYGDECLDWLFWTTLAGIRLLSNLNQR